MSPVNKDGKKKVLYHWFVEQSQISSSGVAEKISRTPTFNETYEITMSVITNTPVVRRRGFTRPIDSYECKLIRSQIKLTFESWLKTDPEFYQRITTDEEFNSLFKIGKRTITTDGEDSD